MKLQSKSKQIKIKENTKYDFYHLLQEILNIESYTNYTEEVIQKIIENEHNNNDKHEKENHYYNNIKK